MLHHTARIHVVTHDAPDRPFAYLDAVDCSPPNKLALAVARMLRTRSQDNEPAKPSRLARLFGKAA